ncbi:hypothetical protein PZE06_27055, partial [Robertmurraya sp. DFI.2.37]|nr:hypothetical protein [Robertmurraya sp. DFI.2.37]
MKIDDRTIELLKATPVSEVWLEELKRLAQESVYMKGFPYKDEVVSIYNGLSETDKKTDSGKTIHTCLFPPVVVNEGDEMVDAD